MNHAHGHPWSLKGGGATKLKARLETKAPTTLGEVTTSVGFAAISGNDYVFFHPDGNLARLGIDPTHWRPLVTGQDVRDWSATPPQQMVWPHDDHGYRLDEQEVSDVMKLFWPHRALLLDRRVFGTPIVERGLKWWEVREVYQSRFETPLTIAFAFVATHNHFVLDRGGSVFNRHAPVIKLPPGATEDDHLALLGYLNSSTACFWMKQVFFDKGNRGEGGGTTSEAWERFYEHDGTKIKQFPLPKGWQVGLVGRIARAMDDLGQQWSAHALDPVAVEAMLDNYPSGSRLRAALQAHKVTKIEIEERLRWLQEELDWAVYGVWGLCEVDLAMEDLPTDIPRLAPGQRPSDVRFAKRVLDGDTGLRFFELCRLPSPEVVASLELGGREARRAAAIDASKNLGLLERPEFKRTFRESFRPTKVGAVLTAWLLDRVEAEVSRASDTRTVRQLARALHGDPKVLAVAEVYADQPDPDLERLLTELVQGDAVPFLAAHRYKAKGLQKYHAWERTWAAQRREDAGEKVKVPQPPKYGSGDFARSEYWRLRGKLDVPKERFIAYPGLEDEDDPTPVLGWAGWDHADRMAALGALYENEADPDKRVPLLAGMLELLLWVKQWHGDDDRYGMPLGEMWAGHIDGELTSHHLTDKDLRAWRPAKKTRGRRSTGGGRKKVTIARDDLLRAFEALYEAGSEGVARNDLADQLGVSSAAVGKAAQPLLDEGAWVVAKKRPVLYAPGAGT